MNIHKFNVKPKSISHKTIKWLIPSEILKYVKKLIQIRGKFIVKKILNFNLKKLNL